jgi:hypothetical protein
MKAVAAPDAEPRSTGPFLTALFDYVRRPMAVPRPEPLSNHAVYALCAHLFSVDCIDAADTTLAAATLAKGRTPARAGSVPLWPPDKAGSG